MKYFFFVLLFFLQLHAQITAYKITPDNTLHVTKQKIKILDAKILHFETKKGIPFHEISDLVYEDGFLYFVSDQGYLYKFLINITDGKITDLQYLDAYFLKNKKGKQLKKKKRDAEGLTLCKNNLLISFERKQRICLYSKNGVKIKKVKLHQDLQNKDNYASKNKGLESVTCNDKYGVVTAPELPLKNAKYHTLYTKNQIFKFSADGSIVSLEFFSENTVLVLLRDFSYFTRRRVSTLMKVYLDRCSASRVCKSEVLAKLDSSNGWKLDNFEGLTHMYANKYLMVSDDNENMLQKTLLVLFEIKDTSKKP
ncbi:esterase-like activity of phytase family protein [Sulfurimonas sediminis]|uniref:Esterase-like activity of phytase family protein n=1 Tax=Sulfurimonas sediminis TaxID=2590020 RepID=A0A7M1B3C0_9BACT|nr:esterase-like activity of phytase family protein [Sulfurimonas sediminis]QOP44249.1 esterase-like activity of phytase family protein [Sulfurimonas sediminis]